MRVFSKHWASRATALAFLLSVACVGGVNAQSASVTGRLNQMQVDLNYLGGLIAELQTAVRNEQSLRQSGASQAAANMEARINALEAEMRNLTGALERVTFELEQAKQQNDQLRSQFDFQLRELESLVASGGTSGSARSNQSTGGSINAGGFRDTGQTLTATILPETSVVPEARGIDPYAITGAPGGLTDRAGPAAARYNRAYQLYAEGGYASAEAAFRSFLESDGGDPLAANASYWLGESLYAQNNFTSAAIQFANGYRSHRDSAKGPDHLYKLALTLEKLDRLSEACGSLALLTSQYSVSHPDLGERAQAQSITFGCGG